jgi:hypothetical protein
MLKTYNISSKDKNSFQDIMNYDGSKIFININVLMELEMYYYLN